VKRLIMFISNKTGQGDQDGDVLATLPTEIPLEVILTPKTTFKGKLKLKDGSSPHPTTYSNNALT
jgi:hypothetical protein